MANGKERPTVVIAGAGGFVGSALARILADRYNVIGLSRELPTPREDDPVTWRRCDLYSLLQAEKALFGANYAVYLVHSMLPSARLTQARFEDLDLILADNFGRAAHKAGAEQILYLGGLIPEGQERSRHLESREEVEAALGAHGVPVTAVRAGLVVGPGGSSLDILTALVRRLPLMITPKWTHTETQPIALHDLLRALDFALGNADFYGQALDVGGPDVLTYREMMQHTADVLGLKRWMFTVPLITPRLSAAWVTMVTGAPKQLVSPLVESLRHPMVVRNRRLLDAIGGAQISFDDALREANEHRPQKAKRRRGLRLPRTARSVQRLATPHGWTARRIAEAYIAWLPRFFRPFLRVSQIGEAVLHFRVLGFGPALLELTLAKERSTEDRALFYVTGGLLSRPPKQDRPRGRLEFRVVKDGEATLAALHDFRPRLPWWIYHLTQATIHLWVMHAFGRYLARLRDAAPSISDSSELEST
jgi:uncharacterized protein YbjT (DUF2867 family)